MMDAVDVKAGAVERKREREREREREIARFKSYSSHAASLARSLASLPSNPSRLSLVTKISRLKYKLADVPQLSWDSCAICFRCLPLISPACPPVPLPGFYPSDGSQRTTARNDYDIHSEFRGPALRERCSLCTPRRSNSMIFLKDRKISCASREEIESSHGMNHEVCSDTFFSIGR